MIIQNPPIEIINDLKRQFNSKDIHIHNFKYKNINLQLIKTFKKQAPSVILGQEKILEHLNNYRLELIDFEGLNIYDYGGGIIF